jgi:hypothetical protein
MKNLKNFIVAQQKTSSKTRESSNIVFNGTEWYLVCVGIKVIYFDPRSHIEIDSGTKYLSVVFDTEFCSIRTELHFIKFTFLNFISVSLEDTDIHIHFNELQEYLAGTDKYILRDREKVKAEFGSAKYPCPSYTNKTLEDCLKLHLLAMCYLHLEHQLFKKSIQNIFKIVPI